MNTTTPHRPVDDRAAEYTVGYILVFGLLLSVAFGTVLFATGALSDTQDASAARTAITQTASYADDVESITDGEGRSRQTTFNLLQGRLMVADQPTTFRISVSGTGVDLTGPQAITVDSYPLLTTIDQEDGQPVEVYYSGGLVARNDPDGASIRQRSPPIRNVQGRASLVLPRLDSSSSGAVATSGTGQSELVVTTRRTDSATVNRAPAGGQLDGQIEIDNSPVTAAWAEYFEARAGFSGVDIDGDGSREYQADIDGDGEDEVVTQFEANTVSIRITSLEVAFDE